MVERAPTRAVVLAHGRGDDCFPFGGPKALRPKHVMEVCDVPLVVRTISALRDAGIPEITVVTGFRAEAVHSVLGPLTERVDLIRAPVWDRGDAPALAYGLRRIGDDRPALVVNGDLLVSADDVRRTCEAWRSAGGEHLALMVDELADGEDRLSWIGVDVADGRVKGFVGHSERTTHRLTGLAVVPEIALPILREAETGTQDRMYLDAQWQRLLDAGTEALAIEPELPVVHVDRCFDYFEANQIARGWELERAAEADGIYAWTAGDAEPDPEFIFPGTIVTPGARLVFEEGSFIGPYNTIEGHRDAVRRGVNPGVLDIRIRGDVKLGAGARIGLNSVIEGRLAAGAGTVIEDSFVGKGVFLGDSCRLRYSAFIRGGTVAGSGSWFECAADFSGVSGPDTHWVHPMQCRVVTGRKMDFGAGNWCGTWRFDSGSARFKIRGRLVTPKDGGLANTVYIGDEVRTGVFMAFAPGTRVGPDTLIGSGIVAGRDCEPGSYYRLRQDIEESDVATIREPRSRND